MIFFVSLHPLLNKVSLFRIRTMNTLGLWFRIVRPQTLFASVCPVVVGLKIGGVLSGVDAIITLVSAVALQVLSNLINDYYDFKRGTDKKGRAGFKRALAEGVVSENQIKNACFVALGVAVLSGTWLIWVGGWLIAVVGVTAILFAWLYTATSKSLSYLGIADVFVFIYYGFVATMGTIYIQWASSVSTVGFWNHVALKGFFGGAVCGLISMCVLAINNIRDVDGDRIAGKRTFPVRFGKTVALVGMGVEVALMPLFAYFAYGFGWEMAVFLPAVGMYVATLRAEGEAYNRCLMSAGLVNACYVILVL